LSSWGAPRGRETFARMVSIEEAALPATHVFFGEAAPAMALVVEPGLQNASQLAVREQVEAQLGVARLGPLLAQGDDGSFTFLRLDGDIRRCERAGS